MPDPSSGSARFRADPRGGPTLDRHELDAIWRLLSGRPLQYALWTVIDLGALIVANGLTAALMATPPISWSWITFIIMLAVRIWVFWSTGLYRAMVRYTGTHALLVLVVGIVLGTGTSIVVAHLFDQPIQSYQYLAVEAMLALVLCGGIRLLVRLAMEWSPGTTKQRVLVYGAGSMGELVHRELGRLGTHRIVGYLDDDPVKHGAGIHGVPVLGGRQQLAEAVAAVKPDLLVLAIADLPLDLTKALFSQCMDLGLRVAFAKGFMTALDEGAPGLRDVAMEDLLRRPSRHLDRKPLEALIGGRSILVTGAGGSIGSELVRQVAALGPARLVLLDHSEYNLYAIDQQVRERFPYLTVDAVLDDLQCATRLDGILQRVRPDVVFHAAAYKHVPLVEDNPARGVLNNVRGFRNLLTAADAAGATRLVLISTDKAVRPTNVMGATKRCCELLLQNYPAKNLKLCAVRFGNVLGSSGSVMPRFLAQIAAGGPITVTHPDITRYFMLIPEAVALVLQSGAMADHGEIFILDMGQPVKIADMARQLIFMHGLRPDVDIKIQFTGLRPGEKLYEELIIDDQEGGTAVDGILVARPTKVPWGDMDQRIHAVIAAAEVGDVTLLGLSLRALVPEWVPDKRWGLLAEKGASHE